MSTKSTIILTRDNEHWYSDCSEYRKCKPYNVFDFKTGKYDREIDYNDAIYLEFDKKNIDIIVNDEDDLVIELKNPDSHIYKIIKNLSNKIHEDDEEYK